MPRQRITYPCTKCGTVFALNPLQSARIRKNPNAPVYCGRACAGVAPSKPHTCAHCGLEFMALPEQRRHAREGQHIFCSRGCYHASRVTYKCDGCAKVFVSTAYERKLFKQRSAVSCSDCRRKVPA